MDMDMDNKKLQSIPWETILELISDLLDTKTVAISSCVSKSWNTLLSSSHIWKSRLVSSYPSITNSGAAPPSPSPHRLYSLLQSHRRRKTRALKIALEDIFFMVDIFEENTSVLSFVVRGNDLATKYRDRCGLFSFDVGVEEDYGVVCGKGARVVWNVVMEGWRGCFLMMEKCLGKGRTWLLEELPAPACCGFRGKGGLVAEVGLGLVDDGEGGRRVERVCLGLMDAEEWRYVGVEHALLYLQDFLL